MINKFVQTIDWTYLCIIENIKFHPNDMIPYNSMYLFYFWSLLSISEGLLFRVEEQTVTSTTSLCLITARSTRWRDDAISDHKRIEDARADFSLHNPWGQGKVELQRNARLKVPIVCSYLKLSGRCVPLNMKLAAGQSVIGAGPVAQIIHWRHFFAGKIMIVILISTSDRGLATVGPTKKSAQCSCPTREASSKRSC